MSEPELHKVLHSKGTWNKQEDPFKSAIAPPWSKALIQRGVVSKLGVTEYSRRSPGIHLSPQERCCFLRGNSSNLAFPCIWLFRSHGVHENFLERNTQGTQPRETLAL